METTLNLSTMPVEIQDMIITRLHPSAALALQQTSHFYRQAVSLTRLDHEDVIEYLHKRELQHLDLWACCTCLTLKPEPAFLVGQIRRHGKNGKKWSKRWCFNCGLESNKVTPGSLIKVKGQPMQVLCTACSTVRQQFCISCKWCEDCAQEGIVPTYRKGRWAEKCGRVGEVVLESQCQGHIWNRYTPGMDRDIYS